MTIIAQQPVSQKTPRVRDSAFMGFVGALGDEQNAGCVCGCRRSPCQVAHVKYGEPCRGHNNLENCNNGWLCGIGISGPHYGCSATGYLYGKKPQMKHDRFTLPLFHECHLMHEGAQHEHNEREWWAAKGIDPLALCKHLQDIFDANHITRAIELGTEAIIEIRRGGPRPGARHVDKLS